MRKNGNTATVIGEVLRGAQTTGAKIAVFNLYALDIKPCIGCFTCRSESTCSQSDAMLAIYEAIKKTDAVVIGSPFYMHQVTGQTKTFFDRLFPLAELTNTGFRPRFGMKKTIMVYSQGNPDPNAYAVAFADNADFMKSGGFDIVDTIVAAGDALPKEEAFAAGKNLVQ